MELAELLSRLQTPGRLSRESATAMPGVKEFIHLFVYINALKWLTRSVF